MHIRHLSLTNFRNYGRLELDLPLGAVLLYGNNAQGKTNLLEAIYYLATTRSPHASQDQQLLNWEAAGAPDPVVVGRLTAQVSAEDAERVVEMRLIQESQGGQQSFRREALVNRRKVRLMDLLGNVRVVLFLPEDIQLITGSPGGRRRYLDITLCQIDNAYCRALSRYNKVLEQRNALLRQLAEGFGAREMLSVYNEKLVEVGSIVFARRARFCRQMGREAQRIHYEALTEGRETLRLYYVPRLGPESLRRADDPAELLAAGEWLQDHAEDVEAVAERFGAVLAEGESEDVARGTSRIGPHRDDWRLWVNGRDLRHYGSRGQQRTALLALKMAEIEWMAAATGESPILLLDEVVAELDETRRALLLYYVRNAGQALLTATDPGMFTADFLRQCHSLHVENGRVLVQKPGRGDG